MLRESTASLEGSLSISKTLKITVLLDVEELKELLTHLNSPYFYTVQGICKKGEGIFSSEKWLHLYEDILEKVKREEAYTPFPAAALSSSPEALYSIKVDENSYLIKPKLPVIQVQPAQVLYSSVDGQLRAVTYGQEGVFWGLHFSYPQLYQDSLTAEVKEVDLTLPNTALFRALQLWIRQSTRATPFLVEGKRVNEPIRLGKNCFSWIAKHPQLVKKGIGIYGAT